MQGTPSETECMAPTPLNIQPNVCMVHILHWFGIFAVQHAPCHHSLTHKRCVENFLVRISGSITFRKPVSRFVLLLLLLLHTHNIQWLVELSIKMKCMLVSFEIDFAPAWIVHTHKRFGCCGCSSAYMCVHVRVRVTIFSFIFVPFGIYSL